MLVKCVHQFLFKDNKILRAHEDLANGMNILRSSVCGCIISGWTTQLSRLHNNITTLNVSLYTDISALKEDTLSSMNVL